LGEGEDEGRPGASQKPSPTLSRREREKARKPLVVGEGRKEKSDPL